MDSATSVSRTAVVVGSGSAGRRHALALRRAMPDGTVIVVRRPDSVQPIAPLVDAGVTIVGSVDDVGDVVTVGVVASPSPFHASAVEALAERSSALLVEKPLAASLADADRIRRTVQRHQVPVVVGYHLRCTDTVQRVRMLLDDGAVGEPRRFRFSVGQHLALWRPGTDPTRSVSARVELGGGVLNELSHEADALRFLLGDVATVAARLDRSGAPTDGSVDTVAELDVTTVGDVVGSLHLDMVADPPHRRWSITGELGALDLDLLTGRIIREFNGSTEVLVPRSAQDERDRAEGRLIANLLALADDLAGPVCPLDDGIAVVAVIEAARRSAAADGAPEPPCPPECLESVSGTR